MSEERILRHWECDYLIVNRYGQERWVADASIQVLDDQNVRIGEVGILQDVTERKQIETSLRQRELILEAITFAAEQFLKSSDWRININEALERLDKTIDATHAYLFEHHIHADGVEYASLSYEWTGSSSKTGWKK